MKICTLFMGFVGKAFITHSNNENCKTLPLATGSLIPMFSLRFTCSKKYMPASI